MKKFLSFLVSVISIVGIFSFVSCEEELPDMRGDIKGIVKDADGKSLDNCLISIMPTGAAKITDSDGSFEFTRLDPGEYTITVKKEGYIEKTEKIVVLSGKVVDVDIVLSFAYGSIKGTVKDAEGALVENCLVSIFPGGNTILTGADGNIEFKDLTPGEYTLTFKKEGFADKTQKVTVVAGKVSDVEVTLECAYGSIKGAVKDTQGASVENCLVSIYPGGNTILTGADGIIEFKDLTPGEYTLTFKKGGFADKTQKVTVVAGKTTDVEVTLGHAYGSIKGIVKESNGSMIENCLVTLTPGGNMIATGTNGSFEYKDLTPGEYTLTFKKEGFVDKTQKVTVTAGKVADVEVTLDYAYGSIKGIVKDSDDGSMIENCLVSLTPGGRSVSTGANGSFEFNDLAPGEYTLGFKKTGYPDKSEKVSVAKGKVTNVDVVMKLEDPITFSENELDFGDFEMTKTLAIFNNSDGDCTFTISNIPSWLSISLTNGGISKQSRTTLVVTADRDKISYGKFEQNLIIAYKGRVSGEAVIKASIEKVLLTTPEVTIYTEAENITETSFDIKGNIVATGGSQILDYGHCWSINEEPTIDDNCTRLGQRDNEGLFVSSITGLTSSSTYYVRAYARNAQGITYSEQIVVTTQSPYNDKWDGTIAKEFAGGSGSKYDPYIIKTGGQLLLIKSYPSSYFELANDIDLDNKNWLPIEKFSGNFDGAGYTVSNLRVDRNDIKYFGLFGSTTGDIKNLTISGVNIKNDGTTGAVAGSASTITNCHVILAQGSVLSGQTTGGIVGHGKLVKDCTVTAIHEDATIKGRTVGGIAGQIAGNYNEDVYATNCHVSCNISGESWIGGIVGHGGEYSNIEQCSYKGNIVGNEYVGGILGYSSRGIGITSCYASVHIEADEYVGGIFGYAYNANSLSPFYVLACYSDGTIVCDNSSASIAAMGHSRHGWCASVRFSYTTMVCKNARFQILGDSTSGDCYSINETDDIAQKMKEAYSDYAHYWNFDNTWTWTGIVDGKQKSVICPRLAWE